jgi:iron-sulfur cluster assembly protein
MGQGGIILTDLAREKVKAAIDKRGRGLGIQIGVRTTGCSGMAYTLEYIDNPPITRDYLTYDMEGFRVWINGKHLPYVDGMVMDWKKQGLNEGFDFSNPNEKGRCGCGESFNV